MSLSLLEFLDTQSEERMIWDYISPSRLNLWMKCPLAFRRKYIDGLETPSSPSLFVGKVTHEVLDAVYSTVQTINQRCWQEGLANYETLIEYDPEQLPQTVCYLFRAKCPVIAKHADAAINDLVVRIKQ